MTIYVQLPTAEYGCYRDAVDAMSPENQARGLRRLVRLFELIQEQASAGDAHARDLLDRARRQQ